MTTEDRFDAADQGTTVLTRIPRQGSVLVRAAAPPAVPVDRCVDVRPGTYAAFDGDRLRFPLRVSYAGESWWFDRSELARIEASVTAFLGDRDRTAVRFGDRTACRTVLADATVTALERRLGAAARNGASTLVTWTEEGPDTGDYRTYDVVIDGPVTRFESG